MSQCRRYKTTSALGTFWSISLMVWWSHRPRADILKMASLPWPVGVRSAAFVKFAAGQRRTESQTPSRRLPRFRAEATHGDPAGLHEAPQVARPRRGHADDVRVSRERRADAGRVVAPRRRVHRQRARLRHHEDQRHVLPEDPQGGAGEQRALHVPGDERRRRGGVQRHAQRHRSVTVGEEEEEGARGTDVREGLRSSSEGLGRTLSGSCQELLKVFRRSFEALLKIFWRSFEDLLKIFWRSFEDLLKIFWRSFEDLLKVLRIFWWAFEDLLKIFWRSSEVILRVCRGSAEDLCRIFLRSFEDLPMIFRVYYGDAYWNDLLVLSIWAKRFGNDFRQSKSFLAF